MACYKVVVRLEGDQRRRASAERDVVPCAGLGAFVTSFVASLAVWGGLVPAPLRAQELVRPLMSAAVGMGVSVDDTGLPGTRAIPAFFATGGLWADRPVGAEVEGFASSAEGRTDGTPVDRLALDAFGVVRPLAWRARLDDRRYRARVARAAGVELGLGLERDGTTTRSGSRFGLHLGARVELPLPLPGYGSDLRVRLAVRRLQGLYTPVVQDIEIGNSLEVYATLVTVF